MRATTLLQLRLPHADTDEEPRRRPRRHAHKRAAASHTAELHVVSATPTHAHDPAVARVREAGGPIDNASYSCACGFVFAASVSTTVRCPHCGADQAW